VDPLQSPEDDHLGPADGSGPDATASVSPAPDLLAEARAHPGGWVYEVHSGYDSRGTVPPHAIRGAWKVDDDGNLTGEYVANEKYQP